MRLTCPDCGAQYEVPAAAIPAVGRDVQCSNCGRTWYQAGAQAGAPPSSSAGPPGAGGRLAQEPAADDPEPWDAVPRVEDDEEADDLAEAEVTAREPAAFAPFPAPSPTGVTTDEAADMATDGPGPPRSTVTPEVAAILQAEAAIEVAARDRERQAPNADSPRPDLGAAGPAAPPPPPAASPLDPADAAPERAQAAEARRRMAEVAAAPLPAWAPADPPAAGARRGRLPDIEAINSTLRPAAEPARTSEGPSGVLSGGPSGRARDQGAFGTGFALALALAAILALLYAFAPRIIAAAPGTQPVLGPYAAAVDEGRLWLDLRLQDLMGERRAAPAELPGPPTDATADAPPARPADAPPAAAPDAPPAVLSQDPAAPAPAE